jgi:hypothetical protein
MLIAHRIALDPDNVQATYFTRACGVARFAYSWALAEWKRQCEAWKANPSLPKPSQQSLRRQLNAIKREQFPWMLEVTKCAPQMAIIQLGQALENFFKKRAKYPTFCKKGVDDRFTLTNDQFIVDGCRIRIPKPGWVRMRESLHFAGKIMLATISRAADRWFASIAVGARGKGIAKAHYEPSKAVINLTRTFGAGPLAHEWFHAIDNFLFRIISNESMGEHGYLSRFREIKTDNPEYSEVVKTLRNLVNSDGGGDINNK